jgi:hypothetical protein
MYPTYGAPVYPGYVVPPPATMAMNQQQVCFLVVFVVVAVNAGVCMCICTDPCHPFLLALLFSPLLFLFFLVLSLYRHSRLTPPMEGDGTPLFGVFCLRGNDACGSFS